MLIKEQIGNRFAKALTSYDENAIAQKQINQRLCEMLQTVGQQKFNTILELGCGTGDLTRLLNKQCNIQSWWLNDLNTAALIKAKENLAQKNIELLATDAETLENALPLTQQFDLLASASTVQWFDKPQNIFTLAKKALKPDGLLLFSTFLPENLLEIKQLTQAGLNYPSKIEWINWLNPHFELLAIDDKPIELIFDNPREVLRHLKATGVTANSPAVSTKIWTKGRIQEFHNAYQKWFSTANGKVRLNYAPLLILAKKNIHPI